MEFLQVLYVRLVERSPHFLAVCNWWQYHFCVEVFKFLAREPIACVGVNLTWMRRTSLHLQHDLTRATCYQPVLRGVFRRLSTLWSMLLPRPRAWIGPINADFRCMIIALHFSRCSTNKFLSQRSWSSARTLFSAFVSKSIVSAIRYCCVVCIQIRFHRA